MKRMFFALVAAFATATTILFVGVASAQDDTRGGGDDGSTTTEEGSAKQGSGDDRPTTTTEEEGSDTATSGETTTAEENGGGSAEVAGRRTIRRTKTFSNPAAITLPLSANIIVQANPYPSTINVNFGQRIKNPKVTKVVLTLNNYSHTFPDDVDLLLVAPNGTTNVIPLSDVCGATNVNNITLTLQDGFPPLPDNGPCTSGTFAPTNVGGGDTFPAPAPTPSGLTAFSTFNGVKANGTWQLFAVDDFGPADQGQFAGGWSLQITAKGKKQRRR